MLSPLDKTVKVILIAFSAVCFFARAGLAKEPECVRVAIMQDVASINLKIKGAYEVIDAKSNRTIYRGRNLNTVVFAGNEGIVLAGLKDTPGRLFIKVEDPYELAIDGRVFRGKIGLIKKENGRLLVVNHIEMEPYIKGILYHESSHYWPLEALKAQAVACRTFALYAKAQNQLKDYDLTSDIYSQVYGGRASERYRTSKAVNDTEGVVLLYGGKIFPAYYHATCGGHTEDASLLWNIDVAALKGVACPYCKDSPHFNWHYVFPKQELVDKLTQAGYKFKRINNITVLGKDASGRVTDLQVSGDKEEKISAKDFRSAAGPNIIKSANFSIAAAGDDFVFEGLGWGHGVGLCQWGAYFMAKGHSYAQILEFYYPGAELSPVPQK